MSATRSRGFGRWVGRHKYTSVSIPIAFVFLVAVVLWLFPLNMAAVDMVAGLVAFVLLVGLLVGYPMRLGYREIQTCRARYPNDPWWTVVGKVLRDIGVGLAAVIEAIAEMIGGLIVFFLFLLGLFVLIWIIKRMWEAA